MRKIALIAIIVALLGVGGCRVYRVFFPGDAAKILKLLDELEAAVAFRASTKPLSQMGNAARLAGFFTQDVEIQAKGPGGGLRTITGRAQLQQIAFSAQSMVGGLRIRFEDVVLELGPKNGEASCRLTAIATGGGDPNPWVQILQFHFREVDGDWLVGRVETVDAVERIL